MARRFCKYGLGDELPAVCAEIWDALRAATDADLTLAQTIVDSAGIIVSNPDLTLCYDERGEPGLLSSLSQVALLLFSRLFSRN